MWSCVHHPQMLSVLPTKMGCPAGQAQAHLVGQRAASIGIHIRQHSAFQLHQAEVLLRWLCCEGNRGTRSSSGGTGGGSEAAAARRLRDEARSGDRTAICGS